MKIKEIKKTCCIVFAMSFVFFGCQQDKCSLKKTCELQPMIAYHPPQRVIQELPSPFSLLSEQERKEDWGRELYLGKQFAKDVDFYRAITCFKSAKFLLQSKSISIIPTTRQLELDRQLEIEYEIFFSYYLAFKYEEAIAVFEETRLKDVTVSFPPVKDLLIMLYDAYIKTDRLERAERILSLIQSLDCEAAERLQLDLAIEKADFRMISKIAESSTVDESVNQFLQNFRMEAKSESKARMLNAFLPGAGYYYVGQTRAAVTSFLINTLFIAASYQLFDRGYIPAAIITTSLEMGWYLGGINGAGLAAREYNERLYEGLGKEVLLKNRLFPILMIQMGF